MHKPKFSIVIPVFKTKFFKEAFESVATQTFDDYEIVVMNDEADGDVSWVQKNPRVRYYENKPRLGPVSNFNEGVKKSQGKFVLIFSDDDIMHVDFLTEVSNFLFKHDVDLVRVMRKDIDGDGNLLGFSPPGRSIEKANEYIYFHTFNGHHCLQDIIVRRTVFLAIGGIKNFPRGWGADLVLAAEIATLRNAIGNLNKILITYRKHSSALSLSVSRSYYSDITSAVQQAFIAINLLIEIHPDEYQTLALVENINCLEYFRKKMFRGVFRDFGIRGLFRHYKSFSQESWARIFFYRTLFYGILERILMGKNYLISCARWIKNLRRN